MNVAYNMDCMEYMRTLPDKAFDLAVVDPPYGIEKAFKATSRIAKYGQMQTVNDAKPSTEYFAELRRVSKEQIIWGYNHLSDLLPPTKEFIFWYKHQPVDTYSDGELAWTSGTKTAKCFDYAYFGGGACRRMQNPSDAKAGCALCVDIQPVRKAGKQDTRHASRQRQQQNCCIRRRAGFCGMRD